MIDNYLTRTVYALYIPETKKIIEDLWQENLHYMYEQPYTKKQDEYHKTFLNQYELFSENDVNVSWNKFPFQYPTNGSTESIREQIAYLKSQNIDTMYLFNGEYEGYEAIARPLGFNIIKIDQDLNVLKQINYKNNSVFFISQPSGLFGNIWKEYDEFLTFMENKNPFVKFYIDLTYLGNVILDKKINLTYENIDGIFFSLSKSFGVYYHRIGGCFLKHENPLLYGNIWFKNLFSLKLGEELMKNIDKNKLVTKYKHYQKLAIQELNKLDISLEPSDVWLIATVNDYNISTELLNSIKRFDSPKQRVCLTPILDKLINGK